jgi:Lecithin retinol acyltransferase
MELGLFAAWHRLCVCRGGNLTAVRPSSRESGRKSALWDIPKGRVKAFWERPSYTSVSREETHMDLMPGTIVKRQLGGFFGLFYSHMGVYVGNGLVVHFNGEKKKSSNAILRMDTVRDFANGKPVSVHVVPKSRRHGEAVCQEALRLHALGEANEWNWLYDFAGRNCEDFCTQCYEVAYV